VSLSIAEANAVQVLVLALTGGEQRDLPTLEQLDDAAALLAEKSSEKLGAGTDAARYRERRALITSRGRRLRLAVAR